MVIEVILYYLCRLSFGRYCNSLFSFFIPCLPFFVLRFSTLPTRNDPSVSFELTHATANRRCTAENNVGIFGVKSNRSPVNTVHRTKNDSVETFGVDMTRGTVPAIQKIQNTIETMQVVHGTGSALEKKIFIEIEILIHHYELIKNGSKLISEHIPEAAGGPELQFGIARPLQK